MLKASGQTLLNVAGTLYYDKKIKQSQTLSFTGRIQMTRPEPTTHLNPQSVYFG